MNSPIRILLALALFPLLALAGCGGGEPADTDPAGPPTAQHKNLFGEMPKVMESKDNPLTEEKITLGRILYYEPRMSASNDISCNSCHDLAEFGVDGVETSPGHDGTFGTRNSPTVYNAAMHFTQFWDGREPTVEAQAKGPILNPVEHGMPTADNVEEVLRGIPEYRPLFTAAFPGEEEPITFDNVALAIGAFERKLTTRGKWDRWLAGDGNALNVQERRGVDTFIEIGCTTCHMGPLLGGNLFQKMGLVEPYPTKDKGRGEVTGQEADNYFFKVPSLRNVAETGPYMHDGSIDSLAEVVRIMVKHQLGKPVTEQQVTDMVVFMKALTGKIDTDYIAEPKLPGMS
jgi:cytochrome c peroxidase